MKLSASHSSSFRLYLYENQLTSAPPELGQLTNLQE
jgi:Leucine-rich repeat (LRR) protein